MAFIIALKDDRHGALYYADVSTTYGGTDRDWVADWADAVTYETASLARTQALHLSRKLVESGDMYVTTDVMLSSYDERGNWVGAVANENGWTA